jgi:prepilin-type N-terminal cleavage/methylation domain-containing protein
MRKTPSSESLVARAAAATRRTAGFTLIELMVALVISTVVVGVTFQILLSQGRFGRLQTASEEAQQNARAAVDLISAELRGVSLDVGILEAAENRVWLRVPRAWGVVCNSPAAEQIAVLFPPEALPVLRNDAAIRADSIAFRTNTVWTVAGVNDITNGGGGLGAVENACNSQMGTTLSAASWAQSSARLYSGSAIPAGVQAPRAGDPVYAFENVEYSIGPAAFPGDWILRNGDPLAGPLAVDGLVFEYRDQNGAAMATPILPGTRNLIRSIHLRVRTVSSGTVAGARQNRQVQTEVFLRNHN